MNINEAKSILAGKGYKLIKESIFNTGSNVADEHIKAITSAFPQLDFVINSRGFDPDHLRFANGKGFYVQLDEEQDGSWIVIWRGDKEIARTQYDQWEDVFKIIKQYI